MPIESDYGLTGAFTTAVYVDDGDVAPKSKRIIESDQAFMVSISWYLDGEALDLAGPNLEFNLQLRAESMGPGVEPILATALIPFVPPAAPTHHSDFAHTFNFAPGALEVGVYRLVVALTATNAGNPINIAGLEDGPLIQIYEPHH